MPEKYCSNCDPSGLPSTQAYRLINPLRVALVGNPNTGKTTLFNALTGLRHRVGNYPGVTVEKRWGTALHPEFRMEILDLPGVVSLDPKSQDEKVVHDVLFGRQEGMERPELIVALADPFHLEKNLYLVLQMQSLGIPMVLALTFMDEARKKCLRIDTRELQQRLGVRVVLICGLHGEGLDTLRQAIAEAAKEAGLDRRQRPEISGQRIRPMVDPAVVYHRIAGLLEGIYSAGEMPRDFRDQLDGVLLHRFAGPAILAAVMFLVFQAVFSWALPPMEWIARGCDTLAAWVHRTMDPSWLGGFLADGVVGGVGAVLSFLPQIILLFFFIGILEDTGYLARAAFLLDKVMHRVGLNGKAFLPLFSCFACVVPGIMASRVIENRKERLITILVAPFMTCSARIPVYTL